MLFYDICFNLIIINIVKIMKLFYQVCLFCFTLTSFNLNSQIIIGETPQPAKSDTTSQLKKKLKTKKEKDGSTEIYFSSTWSKSNRSLVENGTLYGAPLNKRADEKSLATWSYSVGFRNYITKHVLFEGGISYLKNGESYEFKGVDSSFNYQSTYSYIGMPVKAFYYLGKDIRFFAGGGLIPQMFVNYRQDQQWENSVHKKSTATIKTTSDFNSFVISASANVGIQLKYSKSWSLFVMPEYRWQLNSSLMKIADYRHYARVFSVNFGFVYQL